MYPLFQKKVQHVQYISLGGESGITTLRESMYCLFN